MTLTYVYDRLDRMVVIKAIRVPEPSAEVKITLYLNSLELRSIPENPIIPILDHFVSDEGWQFLVMPAWRLMRQPSLILWQMNDYFELLIKSLEGLAFMHKQGIAHNDLSPGNIIFNQDATFDPPAPTVSRWDVQVAYIDFDHSLQFDPKSDESIWIGTHAPGYHYFMAPEIHAEKTKNAYKAIPANREPPKTEAYAVEVLHIHVPKFYDILQDMAHPDPSQRLTAAKALSKFKTLRESIPKSILFALSSGYGKEFLTNRNWASG
ncbi:hypothetical protein M422DRAFT_49197 [Sphaerobolus stellatus SS14]|uniref:Unplaced genomic scaffold SPHSTscaffold_70, whole genome shotgun sequence n=1 Tax=Sphaerobolus stellatus (strain SS14) TaxID=990650 RepID=A0A0C9VFM3_SPHS4|nr:hypothetical protein M422DRAFT_49197 [Sphaerobolus stellatus SS14]